MGKLLNDWLFTGITASAVLMSIRTLDPAHPLAIAARTVGYWLALLCLLVAVMGVWMRWRQSRERR